MSRLLSHSKALPRVSRPSRRTRGRVHVLLPRPALLALSLLLVPMARGAAQPPSDSSARLATPNAVRRDVALLAQRMGLWASVGGGRGTAGLQCDACRSDAGPAFMVHAAVGARPYARFHVGIETWAWLDVIGNGVDRTARGTQLIGRFYPSVRRAAFVTGGVGTSRFGVDDGEARFSASSPAVSLGAGWDLPFRGVVLSPAITLMASSGGALRSARTGNAVADAARLGVWRGTVGITWF